MNTLISHYNLITNRFIPYADIVLPLLARFVFAAVLLIYFWTSANTKLTGPITPSDGAYFQIFPRQIEALGYDFGKLGLWHRVVVLAGAYAEFLLPLLILLGLFTRLAAFGMMGFVTVQSLTDIYGHGIGGEDLGRWFDAASGALIADQRALWIVMLAVLVFQGAGPLSADRWLARKFDAHKIVV